LTLPVKLTRTSRLGVLHWPHDLGPKACSRTKRKAKLKVPEEHCEREPRAAVPTERSREAAPPHIKQTGLVWTRESLSLPGFHCELASPLASPDHTQRQTRRRGLWPPFHATLSLSLSLDPNGWLLGKKLKMVVRGTSPRTSPTPQVHGRDDLPRRARLDTRARARPLPSYPADGIDFLAPGAAPCHTPVRLAPDIFLPSSPGKQAANEAFRCRDATGSEGSRSRIAARRRRVVDSGAMVRAWSVARS
jgi:hypothetical protein